MMGQGDISGTWFNPRTGQKVIARQMINDGDNSYVMTDQGMIDMAEFSQFVQMGDELFDNDGNKIGNAEESIEDVFQEVQEQEYDYSLLNKPLSNKNSTITTPVKHSTIEVKTEEHQEKDINEEILDRAFAKIEGTPRIINVEIDWDGLPIEKIKSMIELMDLSVADVSKYILKKYFKTTNIIENKITKELI